MNQWTTEYLPHSKKAPSDHLPHQPWMVNQIRSSGGETMEAPWRSGPWDPHLRGKNGIHEKIIARPLSSAYKNAKKDLDFSPEHRC